MAIAPTGKELVDDARNAETPADEAGSQSWPSEAAGYFALSAIVFATFLAFLDQTAFGLLAEKMKHSFGMSDFVLGLLLGPSTVVAYVIVGIPLARLVDIYPRKYVLSIGIAVLGTIMALGGLAQNLWQLHRISGSKSRSASEGSSKVVTAPKAKVKVETHGGGARGRCARGRRPCRLR